MTTGDIYHIVGGLSGRRATSFIGGTSDDGIQIDSFMAARVAANDTKGTFTAHFSVPDETGTYCILGGGQAAAVEYFYIAVVAGEIQVKAALAGPNVAWDLITIGANITPHVMHHVALVQDAIKPKIYVDGVEFSLIKGTLTETDVTEPTLWFAAFNNIDGGHIGAADSIAGGAALTLEFKGGISDVKYWDEALTDAQVLADAGDVVNTTDLIFHMDMNGDFIDSVGGENGTAVGDIILNNSYSEFTSRLRFDLAAAPVVADDVNITADNGTGHAIIIKA